MEFLFSKYSGCGNDFILIDNREKIFPTQNPALIANICHRQNGIGADGIILLEESRKADFRMCIFNADGTRAEMCGNGIRCLMRFIQEIAGNWTDCTIESEERIHRITSHDDLISVEMGSPTEVRWDLHIPLLENSACIHLLNTGVPHSVEFVKDLKNADINGRGSLIRNHVSFAPAGVNYNAVQVMDNNVISVRTFERGVEAETLACGTGATASALAAARIYGHQSPVKVLTKSMETLEINFNISKDSIEDVWMAGPAHKIYSGKAEFKVFQLKDTHFLE